MSNGGYKGASPARETSPEQYPGVWELTEQFQAQADGNWPFQADDNAPKSLRFDGSSAYLSRTLTASSNRRVWTMSMWVKRAKLGAIQDLFGAGQEATNDGKYARFQFMADDTFRLRFWTEGVSLDANLQTTRVFRDCSAFYHFVIRHDSTETNQEDRLRIYVNGELITSYSSPDYLSQNVEGHWNFANKTQMIGAHYDGGGSDTDSYFDGYISEVHHIDGQSLPPGEFAFEDGQGIWQPKRFTGDYSSGPVYSNFLTSSGTFATTSEGPDKAFDGIATDQSRAKGSQDNILTFDISSFGFTGLFELWSQNTGAEFSIDGGSNWSAIGDDVWTTVSSDISGVSTIQMRPASGATMKVSAFKSQGQLLIDTSVGRNSFHLDFSDGVKDQSGLGNDWSALNMNLGGDFTYSSPHGSNVTTAEFAKMVDSDLNTYGQASGDFIGFAFAGEKITFKIQNTAADAKLFYIQPATNTSFNFVNGGTWSVSGGSASGNQWTLNANSTETGTFTVPSNYVGTGRIYFSGNNTDFRVYDISPASDTETTKDIFVDSPVNGNEASTGAGGERRGCYATLNPLNSTASTTLSNGNLAMSAGSGWGACMSTVGFTGGKFYYETTVNASNYSYIGVSLATHLPNRYPSQDGSWALLNNGYCYYDQTGSNAITVNTGTSVPAGAVVGTAIDADNGKIWWSVNGSWIGSGSPNPATGADAIFTNIPTDQTLVACLDVYSNSATVNFGQVSFSYAAPAGFSPLATSFLPEPTIKRGDEAMDVALWAGDGAFSRQIKTRLSPDLVWLKVRNASNTWHHITDIMRGAPNKLYPNDTSIEDTAPIYGQVDSLDSDGFTVGDGTHGTNPLSDVNQVGQTYVGWAWDAGEATTTIAVGGLNSSAYDQSQTWSSSSNTSGNVNTSGNHTPVNMFNGILGNESLSGAVTFATYASNSSMTWTSPVTFNNLTSLRLFVDKSGTGAGFLRVNGNNYDSLVTDGWVTISESSLSTIQFGYTGGLNTATGIAGVEVNGRLLIDTGATPPNVPLVATDVRARTDAGFSISKWSKSANNQSYAHGLSQAPEFIIAKSLDGAHSWRVWHKDLDNNKNLLLDLSSQQDTYTDMLDDPDLYKVPLINGGPGATNGGMIAYNFHSLEGYCHIGSYEGGSAPFVFCGFRPRLVYIKNADTNGEEHVLYDSARDVDNPAGATLYADTPGAEYNGNGASFPRNIDILSNGFKVNTGNPVNLSGTHVFVAWAEHPFSSNCRAR